MTGGASATVLALGLVVLLAGGLLGCSALGYQSTTIPVSRDALTFAAGRASAVHDLIAPVLRDGCAAKTLSEEVCRGAAAAEAEYQALAAIYREALAAKRTPPDPAKLLAAAESLMQLAGPYLLKAGLKLPGLL